MSCVGRDTLGHLGFCLDEMLAEIDEQLANLEAVRALAQLNEREARGETLLAVCGKALREGLELQVAGHRLTRARAKLLEVDAVLASGSIADAMVAPPVPVAEMAPVAAAPDATVADLAAYRSKKAEFPKASNGKAPGRAGNVARAMLAAGLLALGGLGSVSYVGQSARLPAFDISVSAFPPPSVTGRAGFAANH